jgi:hypothetical protein
MGGAIAGRGPGGDGLRPPRRSLPDRRLGRDAQRVDRWWEGLRPALSGIYLSFENDTCPDRLFEAVAPDTLTDLGRRRQSMSDYGHALLSRTFVTPTNQPVHHAVEESVVSDHARLDLGTIEATRTLRTLSAGPGRLGQACGRESERRA